ncbi:Uncharacterised protein [Dorea longicatena]|nr:Uncharacterised protein [Dorea longicatena]
MCWTKTKISAGWTLQMPEAVLKKLLILLTELWRY